jgi:hypothetical protein
MTTKAIIKKLVKTKLYENKKAEMLAEMDIMSTIQDSIPVIKSLIPAISYLINVGFLTHRAGKLLLKKYKEGKATESDINNMLREYDPSLSIEYFKRQAFEDKTAIKNEEDTEVTRLKPEEITDPIYFNDDYFFNPDDTTDEITDEVSRLPDTIPLPPKKTSEMDTPIVPYVPKKRPLDEVERFVSNKRKMLSAHWKK